MFLKCWNAVDVLFPFLTGRVNRCAEMSIFTFRTIWQGKMINHYKDTLTCLHAMLCDPSLYLHFLVQILCHIGKWRSRCRCQQILHGTDIFCPSPSCSVLSQHSQILPQKNKIKIFVKGRLRLEKKPLHFFFSTDKVSYVSREPIFHAKLWLY